MKAVFKIAIAASVAAGVVAQPHNHQHRHQHARRHQHDARDVQVEYAFETETEYVNVNNGAVIDASDAEKGLEEGYYQVVGESTPTSSIPSSSSVPVSTPSPTPTPSSSSSPIYSTPTPTPSSADGGEFLEVNAKIASPTTTTSSKKAAATTSSSSGTGVDSDFPDGELDCSTFPSDYGAVCLDNTGLDCWLGYQDVSGSGYTLGSSVSIATFSSPTTGDPQPGYFVGYACPAGYDAAQWPAAQGATGQSIGGIYCDTDNKLYLTRSETTKKLCQKGADNVEVVNNLDEEVCICKTWYPGNEGMYLPNCVQPGETLNLYNPLQSESYEWQGSTTSAQYYVNLKGLDASTACTWTSPSPYAKSAGNWAGINLGMSVDTSGTTYLSVFHNTPTSDASLDFNIDVSGDGCIGCPCGYDADSNETTGSTNGCTVSKPQTWQSCSEGLQMLM